MKTIKLKNIEKTNIVKCPYGDFTSNRFLLQKDNMGYSVTKTIIPKNNNTRFWKYKNHLESCYCIKGHATLINLENKEEFDITPDTLYVLDRHEKHQLITHEDTELICIFNPPLTGRELHNKKGEYEANYDK